MISHGTKRKCQGGDHQVVWDAVTPPGGHWYHQAKDDWSDHPHKAAPRKYKRKAAE